jgi:RNA polymerase-binding transcription factor DksA
MGDEDRLRAAVERERRRAAHQIASLRGSFADIVEAAALTSTDDEHDPEGATIAYERAQVSALLREAEDNLVVLDGALERIGAGTITTCVTCGGPIAFERLLALPWVSTCIGCARRQA